MAIILCYYQVGTPFYEYFSVIYTSLRLHNSCFEIGVALLSLLAVDCTLWQQSCYGNTGLTWFPYYYINVLLYYRITVLLHYHGQCIDVLLYYPKLFLYRILLYVLNYVSALRGQILM